MTLAYILRILVRKGENMPKFQKFFYDLLDVQQHTTENKRIIKKMLQDSTANNRTVSVNQILRYTSSIGRPKATKFARQLSQVYIVLKPLIKNDRRSATKRTDAIDLNELVSTYRAVVMDDRELRQVIGQALSKAE